jgi:hypothetical protein
MKSPPTRLSLPGRRAAARPGNPSLRGFEVEDRPPGQAYGYPVYFSERGRIAVFFIGGAAAIVAFSEC